MFGKRVLFLFFILGSIEEFVSEYYDNCLIPRLEHGRVRMRQRAKLAKFTCLPRYELVGNKYATCRNGQWDVGLPVCVRPSCQIPDVANGLRLISHSGAWVIFFCLPGHQLLGSPVIYCDGMRWNDTAPICVDTTSPPKLSCDFEDAGLCGWVQDDFHDFDWTRINTKTPSSVHYTGPSYDHTLGAGEFGYYMFIESTSQIENDTARLISPVYDSSLAKDGCFSLYYHMYGKTCGGLRVYQKPDNITLRRMLSLSEEEKQTYLIFEKWGNRGDYWLNAITILKDFNVDFQIVIEGIRGRSFTSDIAIDDVAILQGENCTAAVKSTATSTNAPLIMPDSCANRCNLFGEALRDNMECSCDISCIDRRDCCSNFFDLCFLTPDTTPESHESESIRLSYEERPQTLKIVAVTTESTTSTSTTTTTTPAPTTTSTSTSTSTSTTTARPTSTTKRTTITSTRKLTSPTTTQMSTTKKYRTRIIPTKPVSTTKKVTTPASTTTSTNTSTSTTTMRSKLSKPLENDGFLAAIEKSKKEQQIETRTKHEVFKATSPAPPKSVGMSAGAKAVLILLALACVSSGALAGVAALRSGRGRVALARLRSRQRRDPEVRYLSNDVDDD